MKYEAELIRETIKIAGKIFLLERVKNLDKLVDKISDEQFNEDERLPYWAELWPSALALTEYILESPGIFSSKDVLELGCGLGLTTMALALTNPKSLLASDYERAALESTEKNFVLNKISKHLKVMLLDWRTARLEKRFEVIVASDVVYEERFFQPLIDLFTNYLSDQGRVILAEPNRKIAGTFFGKLAIAGFDYTCTDKFVVQGGKTIKVSIYEIYLIKGIAGAD
jgi:ETFB lysine methyltransferase